MTVLTDDEWAALQAALDAVRSRRRRPMKDERRTVEAVVWRLRGEMTRGSTWGGGRAAFEVGP